MATTFAWACYRDLDDPTGAGADRCFGRTGRVPNDNPAALDSSVMHWRGAVKDVEGDDSRSVAEAVKALSFPEVFTPAAGGRWAG